jgi:CSLREA domain-containing protein
VTKTADTNDGVCDADCSLREAISAANGVATDDTVTFDSNVFGTSQVITLGGTSLIIANNGGLIIDGPGADRLGVSGNDQSRVFSLDEDSNVTINGLTITHGSAGIADGGGIYSDGVSSLTLNNLVITKNAAGGPTLGGSGGGIYHSGFGTLTITNSIITNNFAGSFAGGVSSSLGNLTITNSTISNNVARAGAGGMSAASSSSFGSSASLTNSSVVNNTATFQDGGGIDNSGVLNLKNSTISDNIARGSGGGIYNRAPSGRISAINTTISGNKAGITNNGGDGGGIQSLFNTSVTCRNTIIADNTKGAGSIVIANDFRGTFISEGYNLVEAIHPFDISGDTTGNIIGQDPMLDPRPLLNGGTTPTHALRPGSPAIDNGATVNPALTNDQRGVLRPHDSPSVPNAVGGNGSDIGAFERQAYDVSGVPIFDFDGDGKTDLSIYRPSVGEWYYQRSSDGVVPGFQFGSSTDKPVQGDYTGDGKADIAFWRPSTGFWYVLRSEDFLFYGFPWGLSTDLPAPGDFDGDGKMDASVFRPSDTVWYINRSTTGVFIQQFGAAADKPVPSAFIP